MMWEHERGRSLFERSMSKDSETTTQAKHEAIEFCVYEESYILYSQSDSLKDLSFSGNTCLPSWTFARRCLFTAVETKATASTRAEKGTTAAKYHRMEAAC